MDENDETFGVASEPFPSADEFDAILKEIEEDLEKETYDEGTTALDDVLDRLLGDGQGGGWLIGN